MARPHEILVKLERDYRICMSRYERAELATETIVGVKALADADRRIQAERKMLSEKMGRIDYLIRAQVDVEWTPEHLTPLHVPKRERRGEIAKATFRVLKASAKQMKVREIAHAIAPTLGIDRNDHRAIDKLHSAVDGSLQRRLKDGEVEKIEGKPSRWRVLCKKWVWRQSRAAASSVPLMPVDASGGDTTRAASASIRRIPSQAQF